MTDPHRHPEQDEDALAERGRTLVLAAVAAEQAPHGLRERLESERVRAAHSWRGQLRILGPAALGVAALIVTVVAIAISGGGRAPSVPTVALLSLRGHIGAAPAQATDDPRLLDLAVDGVAFPYWDRAFGWEASGRRRDRVGGRDAVTVFYRGRSGAEIGYSIVSGDALEEPDGRVVQRRGVRFVVADDGARQIVTWRRDGHTCVISAPDRVPAARLLALAAWGERG